MQRFGRPPAIDAAAFAVGRKYYVVCFFVVFCKYNQKVDFTPSCSLSCLRKVKRMGKN